MKIIKSNYTFEKLMQKQIVLLRENIFSPYLFGYIKSFNTQQVFLALIENWKKLFHNKGFGGAVLMDLFRAFGTINHDLFIAKPHVYSFSNYSLKLLFSYLNNR